MARLDLAVRLATSPDSTASRSELVELERIVQSNMLKRLYKDWTAKTPTAQVEFVDQVYALCEEHYEHGGDTVVECFTPDEIVAQFKSLADVRRYCGLKIEQALNAREGTDADPEVARAKDFDEQWKK